VDWLREKVVGDGKASLADLDLLHVTDSPEEAVEIIRTTQPVSNG
jgi:hypothetical protein